MSHQQRKKTQKTLLGSAVVLPLWLHWRWSGVTAVAVAVAVAAAWEVRFPQTGSRLKV